MSERNDKTMKKIIALFLVLILAVSLASCIRISISGPDTTVRQTDAATQNGTDKTADDSGIVIGGKTVAFNGESRHGDLCYKGIDGAEKSSYDQVCNLYYPSGDDMLFTIHIVYFKGRDIDEVMDGSDYDISIRTAGGTEYRYFEYEENGEPGHTYVCSAFGTTYTISFVSNFDLTALETAFLSNVHFEAEEE